VEMHLVPDLGDPLVYSMADLNHQPEERWEPDGGQVKEALRCVGVFCRTCRQQWPCATRRALTTLANPRRDQGVWPSRNVRTS
jgi:hypothetical protein